MVSIIDYGAGNLNSVEKAAKYLGVECCVSGDMDRIMESDKVILPGVGAFADAMAHLKKTGLDKAVYRAVERNIPILGICLGMQLFYEQSEENGGSVGLGILKGRIKRFPKECGLKIPQMGWNNLTIQKPSRLFQGLDNPYVYFVHSYCLEAENREEVAAICTYGVTFDAAVETGNIYLTQFHPEKSGEAGLRILKNFFDI